MPQDRPLIDVYAAHRVDLVRFAANLTGSVAAAEDVVQEAWLRLGAADARQTLEEPLGYLYRIVRNLALDGRRRQGFEQRHFIEGAEAWAEQTPSEASSPEAAAAARADLRRVSEALDALPERMRIAVEMHRLGGAKLKEVAACLGISVTAAHQLVSEGVYRCRLALGDKR